MPKNITVLIYHCQKFLDLIYQEQYFGYFSIGLCCSSFISGILCIKM
jgi:hypothetical protein